MSSLLIIEILILLVNSMAGKYADIRYEVLDRCFGNTGRKYFIEDLVEECSIALKERYSDDSNISVRTIRSDIQYLKNKYAGRFELDDKAFEGKRRIFRYKDPKFSIYGLNKSELVKVKDTLAVLLKFRGLQQFEWINEIVVEIKSKLKIDVDEDYPEIMSFESNADYAGLTYITDLFNAIINKRVVRVTYKPFSSPVENTFELHPYYLKQFNSRWYVLGHNPAAKDYKYQVVALDRIAKDGIKEIKVPYLEHNEDWQDYFADFIGVSKEKGEIVQIKLLILDKQQADYIRTKPIHRSQNTVFKEVDGGFEISIKVIPNYELYKTLLSFGERIKVLSPDFVKEEMKKRIEKMKSLY
jgi:predicted DNA-binding transcriptional regulator YafY